MLEESEKRKIKKISKKFFNKIDEDIRIQFSFEEESVYIQTKMEDPQMIIGEKGKTLAGIERLLKIILRRRVEKRFYVNLDINNYKQKKKEYLQQKTREAANEVSLTGIKKKFSPMPAYERRIVHMELSNREDIKTESVGEEPERRVVIKPSS